MPSFNIINNPSEIALSPQWIPSTKFNSKDRVVNAEGKPVDSDYEGNLYRIIEKRERILSTPERIRRGLLGTLAVICTLFLSLFLKSVQNLFLKKKENVRFGVLIPPQKPTHVEPLLPTDIPSYQALMEKMKQEGSTLYITDETGKHPETLLGVLGQGGNKKAIQISKGRALILPNMDCDGLANIATRWERIVLEEVKMSKILSRLGLLSPLSEQVNVALTESSEHIIPAYISETFENLGLKGWFIIDAKNKDSSTWKEREHYLFKSDKERFIEKNWDSVFDSVLTDIAKICFYRIPISYDSLNIAVVKKPSDSAVCQHEVRFFGFDFSCKSEFLAIPDIEQRPLTSPSKARAMELLNRIIYTISSYEFSDGDETPHLRRLKVRLEQRYNKDIITRMDSITNATNTISIK